MASEEIGWLVAAYAAVGLAYAAYFAGFWRGRRQVQTPGVEAGGDLSRIGVIAALVVPACFVLVYFSLAAHLRLGLGRWPTAIGQGPASEWFRWHERFAWSFAVALAFSLLALPGALLVCLWLRRGWLWAGYILIYGLGVLAAWGAMHLAPGSFQNWFWD